jgi:hypothetical protein
VIDAKRIKDDIPVMIKRVEADSDELAISLVLLHVRGLRATIDILLILLSDSKNLSVKSSYGR